MVIYGHARVIGLMDQELLNKKLNTGLTKEEIEAKIAADQLNKDLNVKTKSYGQIVRGNLFSLFNLINLILFVCVLIAGSPKNGLFFLVVLWNFLIGVVQEVRAKKTIEKLSLITAPKVNALRDGKIEVLQSKDVVLGEIMQLKSGSQICADCVILKGECYINESLITGESEPVPKKEGDHLLSGSFLVSGTVMAEAEHIAADNYVNKITVGAKYVKKSNSVILSSVKSVVKVIAFALIPLAGLMIWKNFFAIDQGFSQAMIAVVASISAMIPGGLILLVSLVMTVSVVKLSLKKTLAQDLYCVESLARVDVLCMDKTGTITEGNLKTEEIIKTESFDIKELEAFAREMSDENSTIEAIRGYLGVQREEADIKRQIPFSSELKWSLLKTEEGSLVLGAPEIVAADLGGYAEMVRECEKASKRVVAFAASSELPEGRTLPGGLVLRALIVISDKVRANAKETINYFKDEQVILKVISGDNPETVSRVAVEAGIDGAENYIDARELVSYEEIEAAVEKYTVFGRVTPYQKLDIVKALKSHDHTVAMVGDGANDVLALKEADCSVAMQAGSDAARNVSSLVLLESDFAALPVVVAEGRKTINNLQRSAGLYLTKTTYAFIMTIAFLFITFAYPFQSIQVTLIGAVTIGIPSFFLALEPNANRIKEKFLRNVFSMALPSGIFTFLAIIIAVLAVRFGLGGSDGQIQTAATITAIVVGFIVIFNISGRMDKWKWLLMLLIVIIAAGAMLILPDMFGITLLSAPMWITVICCCAGFALLHTILFRAVVPALNKRR